MNYQEEVAAIVNEEARWEAALRDRLKNTPACGVPWKPHEGPPICTPAKALELYRASLAARGSNALCRTILTDEQREEFVGDAKSS